MFPSPSLHITHQTFSHVICQHYSSWFLFALCFHDCLFHVGGLKKKFSSDPLQTMSPVSKRCEARRHRGVGHLCQLAAAAPRGKTRFHRHNMGHVKTIAEAPSCITTMETGMMRLGNLKRRINKNRTTHQGVFSEILCPSGVAVACWQRWPTLRASTCPLKRTCESARFTIWNVLEGMYSSGLFSFCLL